MKPRVYKENPALVGEWPYWVGVNYLGQKAYFSRWDYALEYALN